MNRQRLRIAGVHLAIAVIMTTRVQPAAAQASPWQFGFGLGARVPMHNTYADSRRSDFNTLAWVGLVSPLLSYGGPRIELGYHHVQLAFQDTTDASVQTVEFSINWMWVTPPHRGLEAYAMFGTGLYYNNFVLTEIPKDPTLPFFNKKLPEYTTHGINAGLGVFFHDNMFAELRVHRVSNGAPHPDDTRRTAILPTFNLGLRF